MKTNAGTKTNAKELRRSIDGLLAEIRQRQQVLISPDELWGEPLEVEPEASGYLQALLDYGDVRVCADPGLHRGQWKHIGNGRYICEICQKLNPLVLTTEHEEVAMTEEEEEAFLKWLFGPVVAEEQEG
jgi:hypothetical protein